MFKYRNVLDVKIDASIDDINKAYKELAKKYHPDRPGGDTKKFQEINEAHKILIRENDAPAEEINVPEPDTSPLAFLKKIKTQMCKHGYKCIHKWTNCRYCHDIYNDNKYISPIGNFYIRQDILSEFIPVEDNSDFYDKTHTYPRSTPYYTQTLKNVKTQFCWYGYNCKYECEK